jgi:hypothetical protein
MLTSSRARTKANRRSDDSQKPTERGSLRLPLEEPVEIAAVARICNSTALRRMLSFDISLDSQELLNCLLASGGERSQTVPHEPS